MERGSVEALSEKQKQCQMKRACVMRLQRSPERPCRLAFVCNYCLIKHAGQLPGFGPLATDTQLYTECLQPPETRPLPRCPASIFAGNLQKTKQNKKNPWCVAPPPYACATEGQLCTAAGGQVRSLFSHKDNTIILKRSWSPVIEFSKGSGLLWGGGGQLFESGGRRWLTSPEIKRANDPRDGWSEITGFCLRNLKHIGDLARLEASHLGETCRGGKLLVVLRKPKLESDPENRFSRSAVISRSRDTKGPVISTSVELRTQSSKWPTALWWLPKMVKIQSGLTFDQIIKDSLL